MTEVITTIQTINTDTDTDTHRIKNFDIIINLLKKYVNKYRPIFFESFNEGYPIENTYILQIPFIIIPKIIQVLKILNYKNESYISNDEKFITGLTYKSYAFYKEKKIENNTKQIHFLFCLEDDKNCKGLLLSPNF